ncbi:MAG TPA: glycoside hydrolase family 15 protein [Mycobacteriales bacterium]|nr:glycoside hydrolase family 15 protein [Mycobacteriales bacterium]
MALLIEDYAFIGDTQTGALVGRDGSIDWLCLPRFDSPACFAGLLGTDDNGHWRIAPRDVAPHDLSVHRSYRGDTLVLETEMTTPTGVVRIVDAMPIADETDADDQHEVVRLVEGVRGRVAMRSELRLRFDYGSVVPWVRRLDGCIVAVAGPDAVALATPAETYGRDMATYSDFDIRAGEVVPFTLTWHPSHLPPPRALRTEQSINLVEHTESWWSTWIAQSTYDGDWQDAVRRSLLTLKGLSYTPTGGIVAAATTSLPEAIGGERNWDYRYCWLRDATITLLSLVGAGFDQEAARWREWLLRAVAGDVRELQILYGIAGERRQTEYELPWLPGYEGSKPVRVGNAAADQLQLDVYGEVIDALHVARRHGLRSDVTRPEDRIGDGAGLDPSWPLQQQMLGYLEGAWQQPDDGIWEVRGPRRHFTHSKVMVWVAFDRAVRAVQEDGLPGDAERWARARDAVRADVLANAWNPTRNAFTQSYGSHDLDAAVLQMPLVGFLPADDPRMLATTEAIERELMDDGFVRRYETATGEHEVDGLHGEEGAFLACTFWLAEVLAMRGDTDRGAELFDRLLGLRNDVGLLAEEWDPHRQRMTGNFPQAFSHVPLVTTASHLSTARHLRTGTLSR